MKEEISSNFEGNNHPNSILDFDEKVLKEMESEKINELFSEMFEKGILNDRNLPLFSQTRLNCISVDCIFSRDYPFEKMINQSKKITRSFYLTREMIKIIFSFENLERLTIVKYPKQSFP